MNRKIFTVCDRAIALLTKLAASVAGLCILATAFIIVYEIVMRSFLHAPTEWVLEMSVYLILVAGFLGLAIAYREQAHVKVDLFVAHLPHRWRLTADILTALAGIVFCIVFVWESADMVQTSFAFDRTSPSTLRVPLFIPQLSLVIGGALLLLEFIRRLVLDICALADGRKGGRA